MTLARICNPSAW